MRKHIDFFICFSGLRPRSFSEIICLVYVNNYLDRNKTVDKLTSTVGKKD